MQLAKIIHPKSVHSLLLTGLEPDRVSKPDRSTSVAVTPTGSAQVQFSWQGCADTKVANKYVHVHDVTTNKGKRIQSIPAHLEPIKLTGHWLRPYEKVHDHVGATKLENSGSRADQLFQTHLLPRLQVLTQKQDPFVQNMMQHHADVAIQAIAKKKTGPATVLFVVLVCCVAIERSFLRSHLLPVVQLRNLVRNSPSSSQTASSRHHIALTTPTRSLRHQSLHSVAAAKNEALDPGLPRYRQLLAHHSPTFKAPIYPPLDPSWNFGCPSKCSVL